MNYNKLSLFNFMNLNLRPPLNFEGMPRLRFQVLAVEVCEKAPPSLDVSDLAVLRQDSNYINDAVYESAHERGAHMCEVCVFGVSTSGHSLVVRVHGFMPHFFVEVTPLTTRAVLDKCVRAMREMFDVWTIGLEFVERKRMYGWVPTPTDPLTVATFFFGRFTFPNPYLMRRASMLLENRQFGWLKETPSVSESRVAPSEKFLAAHNIKASGWVEIDPQNYTRVPPTAAVTVAQFEARCGMGALHPLERESIAPLVIAAVDIEAHSSDYRSFPSASTPGDKITFIGTTFWVYGDSSPRERIMQVCGSCDVPTDPSVRVFAYESEYDLLMAWRDLIAVDGNPDMVVTYNGTGFDFAYLAGRVAHLLATTHRLRRSCRFNYMGRILLCPGPLQTRELTSAAKGQNMMSWFPQPGRVQLDLFMYVKDSEKMSSYKLDDVSAKFLPGARKVVLDHPGWVRATLGNATHHLERLAAEFGGGGEVATHLATAAACCPEEGGGDEKAYLPCNAAVLRAIGAMTKCVPHLRQEEVRGVVDREVQPHLDASGDNNYRKLFRLYDAGAAARAAIAVYCQVDCDLVVMLVDRLNVVANIFQMSQVCNTLVDDVCNRGQQIKTYNLISRFASANNYILNVRDCGWDPKAEYEGATVLDPQVGYYQVPVATLDFASLYPSLMRGFNLCHSSLVLDDAYKNLPGVKYGRYDIGGRTWTFQESTPGLLPTILGALLDARKAKKREMKKHPKGSFEYRLCDGAQLALKVSCNSVYGFCGVTTHGMYPCMPVAVATTFNGRRAIDMTKKFMETTYNATVIYGDTDSVMVTFPGVTTVAEAFPLALRAAAAATSIFPEAIVLEFEKVFFPYLLVKKKTYAGMKYEDDPTATPTLDVKGLAVVRRDNCELVRDVMREVLEMTMARRDPMGAYAVVKKAVGDIMAGLVPLTKLQISNSLKNIESYTNTAQPQLTVVRKMRERHAFDIPRSGDRVPYVICHHPRLPRVSDRAEHPSFVEENNVPIDKEYYLVSQLQRRLEVITDPLPVPDIAAMIAQAVTCVRDAHLDQEAIGKLCQTVARPPVAADAPRLAPRVVKRKRGGGWGETKGVVPLVEAAARATPAARRGAKKWDAAKADVGVLSLVEMMGKK